MKEAFCRFKFTPDQLSILETADRICSYYTRRQRTLNSLQLFWKMINKGVISKSYSSTEFHRLLHKGLWAGEVDWNLRPSRPLPPFMHVGSEPIELWVRSYHLTSWAIDRAHEHDITLVVDWHTNFTDQSLYYACNRLEPYFGTTCPAILCLTDNKPNKNQTFQRLEHNLKQMLEVRIARDYFNSNINQELWGYSKLYLPKGKHPIDYKKEIYNARKEAGDLVERSFIFKNLTRLLDFGSDVSSQYRYLHMADVEGLDKSLTKTIQQIRYYQDTINA